MRHSADETEQSDCATIACVSSLLSLSQWRVVVERRHLGRRRGRGVVTTRREPWRSLVRPTDRFRTNSETPRWRLNARVGRERRSATVMIRKMLRSLPEQVGERWRVVYERNILVRRGGHSNRVAAVTGPSLVVWNSSLRFMSNPAFKTKYFFYFRKWYFLKWIQIIYTSFF